MSAAPGVGAASSAKNSGPPAKAFVPPAKPSLPTVLLYPASPGDVAALVDLRTRLRVDGHVSVLTYDPESAAIQRASAEGSHPEWLVSAPANDSGRMTLARALGASFYAVVSPGRASDTTHVELVETAPAARTFDWTGTNRQFGVRALESQVADAVDHPAAYTTAGDLTASAVPPVPASSVTAAPLSDAPVSGILSTPIPGSSPPAVAAAPAPISAPAVVPTPAVAAAAPVPMPVVAAAAPAPVPMPVLPAPVPVLPLPTAVAAVPVSIAAPMKIAVPMAVRPVPAAPLPLIKTAPLTLPVPIAQAVPVSPPVAAPLPKIAAVPPKVAAAPVPAAVPAPKPVIAPAPKVADVPLPKAAPAAPAPPLTTALPAPRLNPLPTPTPTLPQVAAVPLPKTITAPALPMRVAAPPVIPPPVQVATLPKREIPVPASALPPPFLPPAAPSARPAPATPFTVKKADAKAEDMTAIEPLLAKGDAALDGGDAVTAIALYRQAINGAPRSIVPRLKLAQAYQKDGLNDRALDEARRALEIAPDSAPVQQFLLNLDQQTGTTAGALVRDRAAVSRDPSSPAAHAALADTLWNSGDLGSAEAEYKSAAALAPAGSHEAQAQLAQLYAAEARYDDCLAILKNGGKGSYAVAIQIVKNRTDTLSSTLEASRDASAAGKSTREQFYDDAKKLSAEAQALAGFVAQIAPPPAFKLSHLHRMLSTNLLAQETAALVTFIETGDARQNDTISQLEHAAAMEMLTAQATEEKLGLWKQKPQLRGSAAE